MEQFYPLLIIAIGFLVALGMMRVRTRLSARTNALGSAAVAAGVIIYAIASGANIYPFLIALIIGYPAIRHYFAEWRIERSAR